MTAAAAASPGVRLDPAALAVALGQPPPTPEQAAAIAAPLEPGVVVAGAGSGKTETMAARVVWLVANGLVRPDQVLGLTFTRKAARELAARVRRRLAAVRERGVLDGRPDLAEAIAGEPTVTTYDAYAGRIVDEHALRLGHEPGSRLVTEAVCWQLATRAVEAYDGPMDDVELAASTVVDKVLALHGELAGHLVEPSAVQAFTERLHRHVLALPRGGDGAPGAPYRDVREALARQRARLALLPLVAEYRRLKRREEVVDFGDRAALAAQLAVDVPEVGAGERSTYAVVLLDEYQDTSHAQLVLLRGLFGDGHPVTAVGDPCQSIYGWRGASAGTLPAFRRSFRTGDGRGARLDHLTRSFRNAPEVLTVANTVSQPLRAEGLDVPELVPAEGAAPGRVEAAWYATVEDEAVAVAAHAGALLSAGSGHSVAVLVRQRAQIPRIEAALREAGVPVEVVGVGGLLTTPEVADVVATLRVVADPQRGDAAMRLLTGARWRLGPRDVAALGRWAAHLARTRSGRPGGSTLELTPDEVDGVSLVDALDDPPPPGWLSEEGRRRVLALGRELSALRARAAEPLPDLVADVERTLGLDVEVAARPGPVGRANLDRFLDVAADFAGTGDDPGLRGFLAYLAAAEDEERGLDPGEVEVVGDRVQVLTVHGAKGLEWDAVFVPGLAEELFPASARGATGWLTDVGAIPWTLRGDADALPVFDPSAAADQKAVEDLRLEFVERCRERHRREERRLAYVALTRARQVLLCSGHRWSDTRSTPMRPGEFLLEVREACAAGAGTVSAWSDDASSANPLAERDPAHPWPADPLGARRAALDEAAALVRAADPHASPPAGDPWARDVDVLLTERARRGDGRAGEVVLPAHLSVSALVQLGSDPAGLARRLRRPLPVPPAPMARRGTAFHAWLERRWGQVALLDVDELPGSGDESAAPDAQLAALQAAFERSAWADRMPVEVEAAFELALGPVVLRGRADAVFATPDGGLEVVDWKTGPPPRDDAELAVRAVQLAAYRLAFAELRGLAPQRVRASFHHVREDVTVRPADLLDADDLRRLVSRAVDDDA